MSQEFFDPELFADFIAEAKEHLETIEPNLLELEKAPTNLALLNDIFRPMHSLKGASGFLGLNRINQLAHKSENILDELRKGSMVVTSEIMDVILASTDALRQMIDNLEASNTEGDVETGHIIAQIDAIMAGGSSPAAPAPPAAGQAAETEDAAEHWTQTSEEISDGDTAGAVGAEPARTPRIGATEAAQSGEADGGEGMSTKEWIATLPLREPYALASFGEGHLKDFIDESSDIVENLNDGLLKLEENPAGQDELVHDIFRFFHNMKGNSGIIGYNEMNALTHEAETLLNNVRQGKIAVSHDLIDLLLLVVDTLEALVQHIDISAGIATAFDTALVVKQLQQVLNGGPVALPPELLAAQRGGGKAEKSGGTRATDETNAPSSGPSVVPVIIPAGTDGEDVDVFRVTVRQQMEIIRAALEMLKQNGDNKDSIDALYRCLVATKNACAFVGQADIKVYAERTAGIVDQGRKSGIDFSMMVDLLSQEVSIIDDMVQKALAEGQIGSAAQPPQAATLARSVEVHPADSAPDSAHDTKSDTETKPVGGRIPAAKATPSSPPDTGKAKAPAAKAVPQQANNAAAQDAHKGSSTIRVDHERLDHLMNLIGELIINRNRYSLIARSLEDDRNIDIAQVAQSLSETTYAMARISDDLQDTIMKVRMVPVSSVFSRFPRLVRDLSRKSGKEVDLIMEGEETELDKSVVEVIGDPLVHLIRNSVDHGVEPEDVRVAAGKPAKGKVTLRAFHKGNSVAIEIEDDGKGIDPDKMREVAVRKGI
ncbi:MAG: Hpt domain-containing protein, partial [Desulfovibrio sp.]|nr:Hpt domain-containing protein [Desulfovibrio sp.]